MTNSMLATAFRLVIFWLYFTGARCAGNVSVGGPVSLSTPLPTSSHPPASSSSSSNMTSTSGSPAPSSTQSTFSLNTINNMTTCTLGPITWTYTGPSADLLLSITNVVDPYQSDKLARRQNTAGTSVFLADINATSHSWMWPQVNVSQGWYQLQGTVSPLSALSAAFFITNGSDVSCLLASSSSSSATGSSTSTVGTLDTGEIIGVVLGILAGLGIIVVVVAYCLRRRSRGNWRRPDTKANMGRWGSLKSNHSIVKSPLEDSVGDTSTAQSDATELTRESLPDVTSPVGEKLGLYRPTQPTFPSDSMRSPPSSYSRRMSLQTHSNPPTPSDSHYRRRSELHFEQQAARIRSSMQDSVYLRSERLSLPASPRSPTSPRGRHEYPPSTTATSFNREHDEYPSSPVTTGFSHRGRDEYPPSPLATDSPQRGQDEGSSFPTAVDSISRSPSTRRAPRKPVPHFDLSELDNSTGSSQEAQPTTISDDASPSSLDVSALPDNLNFGNHSRMHYLIPDMPPQSNQ